MTPINRRQALKTGLVLIASATAASIFRPVDADPAEGDAYAGTFTGGVPWKSRPIVLPEPVTNDVRVFFTDAEAALVAAIQERLIPADELGMSAVEAGCVRFVDHQLAGPFGQAASRYQRGPFREGTPEQGSQSRSTPADTYRRGLAEFDAQVHEHTGHTFVELSPDARDAFLERMEAGDVRFRDVDGQAFFALLLQNVREGYLADPIYGGNRDMVGWKMIGFPGARYDYRDYLGQIGKTISIQPVSLIDRA
ncbi:gluconate 2-dehydrogenase subunit 3 family protein [Burkholderia gladioli]|uniref:gluconate 2-dehydrogenase subunit 3 family protein n=1 Tax=Burkholderia gladioli TaxID=28095 RepID=UPI001ABBB459|nr:gluconate 2-dehydrogenase subunit 3 family protein [Burkholderia gladioli]